jgi:hypothetical protein
VDPSRFWLERRRSRYSVVPVSPDKKRGGYQKASVAGVDGSIAQGHASPLRRPITRPVRIEQRCGHKVGAMSARRRNRSNEAHSLQSIYGCHHTYTEGRVLKAGPDPGSRLEEGPHGCRKPASGPERKPERTTPWRRRMVRGATFGKRSRTMAAKKRKTAKKTAKRRKRK